jgi:tetratricopeptide (TPR) repeat protein
MSENSADLASVESEVQAALRERPDHPGLLAALGGIFVQRGEYGQAVEVLARAALFANGDLRILSDYGAALTMAGRAAEAEQVLKMAKLSGGADDNLLFNLARCLHMQQKHAEALTVLQAVHQAADDVCKLRGDLHKELGDWRSAASAYFEAMRLNPGCASYLNDLGVLLELNGDPAQRLAYWDSVVQNKDAHPIAFFFFGNALAAENRLNEALAAYEQATTLAPNMAEALNNQALILGKLGREAEAVEVLQRAAVADPRQAAAQCNLGSILARNNALTEAEAMFSRALALDPDCIDVQVNYGVVLMRQRRFAEAEPSFRSVLARAPGNSSAEANLGLLKLNIGDWEQGWPYYESRWKMPQLAEKRPPLRSPVWTGEPLDGKRLFVFSEQGFGDNIQFVRYLNVLHERFPTAKIVLYALHSLLGLLRASFSESEWCAILPWGDTIPEHDLHIPLLSLPWRCGTSVATIPASLSYLRVDPERAATWHERLQGLASPAVGLVWSSSETFIYRSSKAVALKALQPLLEVEGITWVNLQFGKDAEQIAEGGFGSLFVDPMPDVRDFGDTAAIVDQLDLVITVDTAVAHLAGALGRPVWMLDRYDTDWRWLPPREDSPWYPTMRIFRQEEFGQWPAVVERARQALIAFVTEKKVSQ